MTHPPMEKGGEVDEKRLKYQEHVQNQSLPEHSQQEGEGEAGRGASAADDAADFSFLLAAADGALLLFVVVLVAVAPPRLVFAWRAGAFATASLRRACVPFPPSFPSLAFSPLLAPLSSSFPPFLSPH